jgi:hypothetical protein
MSECARNFPLWMSCDVRVMLELARVDDTPTPSLTV